MKIEDLPEITMEEAKNGDYIMEIGATTRIFKVVRSGDVMQSMSPETTVLQVYVDVSGKEQPGQVQIDYFNCTFKKFPDQKMADWWGQVMEMCWSDNTPEEIQASLGSKGA